METQTWDDWALSLAWQSRSWSRLKVKGPDAFWKWGGREEIRGRISRSIAEREGWFQISFVFSARIRKRSRVITTGNLSLNSFTDLKSRSADLESVFKLMMDTVIMTSPGQNWDPKSSLQHWAIMVCNRSRCIFLPRACLSALVLSEGKADGTNWSCAPHAKAFLSHR